MSTPIGSTFESIRPKVPGERPWQYATAYTTPQGWGCQTRRLMTMQQIDDYLTYLRDVRRMAANTLESYARDLGSLAAFADARKSPIEALQRTDLEAFVRHLRTSGLAPRSIARVVASVR